MNREQEGPLESEIDLFAEVLSVGDTEHGPVIVGGHAAGLWSRYFLAKGVTELAGYLPFRSKDLDLVGTAELLTALHRRFHGELMRAEPRSPVMGRIDIPQQGGRFLRVEVLRTVLGLTRDEVQRTVRIEVAGIAGRIPFPHLVLKAKLANSALIDQNGRQDVKHVRMMVLCVHAFIRQFIGNVLEGRLTERALVNLLNEVHEVVTSEHALNAVKQWDFDLSGVWPTEELAALDAPKVARWLGHRFP